MKPHKNQTDILAIMDMTSGQPEAHPKSKSIMQKMLSVVGTTLIGGVVGTVALSAGGAALMAIAYHFGYRQDIFLGEQSLKDHVTLGVITFGIGCGLPGGLILGGAKGIENNFPENKKDIYNETTKEFQPVVSSLNKNNFIPVSNKPV